MSNKKSLTDFLAELETTSTKSSLKRFSILYLADFVGVETGHDFSYNHYSITARANGVTQGFLNEQQSALVTALMPLDSAVLDTVCSFVRFSRLNCQPEEVERIVHGLKGHTPEKFLEAKMIASRLLGLKFPNSSEVSLVVHPAPNSVGQIS